jgi:predicted enzyme related to lactoylglutathione lyase
MAAKKSAAKKSKAKKKAARPTRSPSKPVAKKTARPAKKAARTAKRAPARKSTSTRHPIMHWEIQSQDPKRLHDFYAAALGWVIDANNPMNYGMVASGGERGIDGGIGGSMAPGSRVLVYAQVPSISEVLDRIESLGGRTIMPRTDIGPVVMALYLDPEGNTMGLIEPGMG